MAFRCPPLCKVAGRDAGAVGSGFPWKSATTEFTNPTPYLEQRFGADSITALTETSLLERPAWAYAFRWDEGERSVLLLQVARDTYRIIYDPRSKLNTHVIATLTIAE